MTCMDDKGEEGFSKYVRAWRIRLKQRENRKRDELQRLRGVARACARCLVRDFGARRVYLFGSLLDEELVHDGSDIDLAVEGLEGRLYFRALSEVWKLLPPGVELDLVLLEQAWPGLAERVKAEGVLLDAAA